MARILLGARKGFKGVSNQLLRLRYLHLQATSTTSYNHIKASDIIDSPCEVLFLKEVPGRHVTLHG